jgi:hypothetical protein
MSTTPPRIIIKPLRVSDLADPKVASIQPGESFVVENSTTTEQYYKRFSDGAVVKLTNTDSAETYVHPTGDGNMHVPATGVNSNGRFLRAGNAPGVFSWSSIDWSDIANKPNLQYSLPNASANTLGGVKVGGGLLMSPEGVLSVDSDAVVEAGGGGAGGAGNSNLFEFNVRFAGSVPSVIENLPTGWAASIAGNLVTVVHTAGKPLKQINFWGYSESGGIERYRLPSASNEVTIPYAQRNAQFIFTISTSVAGADLDGSARVVVAF